MSEATTKDDLSPSAVPTDGDIRRWQALPRDEQLERLRDALRAAEASGISDKSMDAIKSAAKARLANLEHG